MVPPEAPPLLAAPGAPPLADTPPVPVPVLPPLLVADGGVDEQASRPEVAAIAAMRSWLRARVATITAAS
jgi:hypothetical protein